MKLPEGVRIFFGILSDFSASGFISRKFFFKPARNPLRLILELPKSIDFVELITRRGEKFFSVDSSVLILSIFLSSPACKASNFLRKSSLLSIGENFSSSSGFFSKSFGNLNYFIEFLKEK